MSRLTLYKDNLTDSTIVSNHFIDEYMKDANDAQIKVYLYLLRMMNSNLPTSISDIVDKFNHTEKDVIRALTYWEKRNLLRLDYDDKGEICGLHMNCVSASSKEAQIVPMPKIVPAPEKESSSFEKPSYTTDDISAFKKSEDGDQLTFIAQAYRGKPLTRSDIETLIFIHEELHFSVELIDYLIEYCVGKGKRGMRYIEKVAIDWAEKNITTVSQAENMGPLYDQEVYTIMKALGQQNAPTETEVAFIRRWQNYGYTLDVILLACEKTVLATSSHRFEYADAIISRWHKSELHNLNEINKAEGEFSKNKNSKTAKGAATKPVNSFNSFSQQRDYDFDKLEKELFSN